MFAADLRRSSTKLWYQLGQIQSLIEAIERIPLLPAVAEMLGQTFLAKGALGTTAIEGNTLTEEQARLAVDHRLELPPSRDYLRREIENVIGLYNAIARDVRENRLQSLSTEVICEVNQRILAGLEVAAEVVPGRIREHSVEVMRYRGAPAEDCAYLLDRLSRWLEDPEEWRPLEGFPAAHALLRALLAHLYLAWIHPFGDGNGRVARAIEFRLLLGAGVPFLCCHLLSSFYSLTKQKYLHVLDRASREPDGYLAFLEYAVEGFRDSLQEQFDMVGGYLLDVVWKHMIFTWFRENTKLHDRHKRQRDLLLELTPVFLERERTHPATPSLSPAEISRLPGVAALYARRSGRTLSRDLNDLQRADFLRSVPGAGLVTRHDKVFQLLPERASRSAARPDPL